jgi:DNA-binding SARP family transcriptional activator
LLTIRLFGRFYLSMGEEPLPFHAPPRTLPLLAYLLLHRNEPIARQSLSFILWPDESEDSARANLRRHLHWLRHSLPAPPTDHPWLLSDAKSLQWNPAADYFLDVAEFEHLSAVDEGLSQAVELYQGDLLSDLYDDWILNERERLRDRFFECLGRLVQQYRLERDYPQAIAFSRRWLTHDPLREDVLRQLVALRYEAGDRAGAIEEYESFRQRLHHELGISPMPETITLFETVLRQESLPQSITTSPPSTLLPTLLPQVFSLPFVGREREIQTLQARWREVYSGRGGLVLIGGEAGIGKTRLASEFALSVEARGGRVLRGTTLPSESAPYQPIIAALRSALPMLAAVEMEPLELATVGTVLPELIVRRAPQGKAPPALPRLDAERERRRLFEALARCLESLARPRPVLLILEDLHWAGAGTLALLEYLARRVSQSPVLILATYRKESTQGAHPLRDLRHRLQSEALLTHLSLEPLSAQTVRELVTTQVAQGADPTAMAARLYALSGGNPLFLRELIRDLAQAGVVHEQEGGWQFVFVPEELSLPESLGHLISQRLESLSAPARSLVEVAAVVGSAFDLELVSEVGAWQEGQVLDNLDELLDQQIVQEAAGGGHFDFTFTHDLIRRVIYESTPEDVRKRRHRRIGHVMENLRANELDPLAGELALHFEHGGEPERAALYFQQIARRSLVLYADEEALSASQHALSLSTDPRLRFDLLALREEIFHRRGERPVQQETLEDLMVQAQSLEDDELVCEVLRRRIRYHSELGEREAQENLIAELKARAVALQKPLWMVESSLAEAGYHALRADYEQASLLAEQALDLARQISDYRGQISAYLILIDVATQRWDFPALQANLESLTALVEEHSDQGTLVKSLRAAASAAFSRQEFDVSESLSQQMLDLCQRIGDREGEGDAHSRLAMIAARLFHIKEARHHYAQAAALYRQVRKRQGQASVLLNNGLFLARLGRYAESRQTFIQAAALFDEMGDARGQAICALNRCAVAIYQGDWTEAETQARLCQKVSHEVGLGAVEALALGNLGEIALRQGQPLRAIRHLRKAIASRHKSGIPEAVSVMDLSALLEAYLTSGNLPRAHQTAEKLLALYRLDPQSIEYPQYVLWALSLLHRTTKETEKADDYLTQAYDLLQQRAAAIPDEESRTSFLKMPYNRCVLEDYERNTRLKPDG